MKLGRKNFPLTMLCLIVLVLGCKEHQEYSEPISTLGVPCESEEQYALDTRNALAEWIKAEIPSQTNVPNVDAVKLLQEQIEQATSDLSACTTHLLIIRSQGQCPTCIERLRADLSKAYQFVAMKNAAGQGLDVDDVLTIHIFLL